MIMPAAHTPPRDLPLPIVTPRLALRAPVAGDAAAMAAAVRETWADLSLWMLWAKGAPEDVTEESYALILQEAHDNFIARADLMMLGFCRETGEFVIGTGLHRLDWERRICEIGVWVRQSRHGKGYAGEATTALLHYGFDVLKAAKMVIKHADGNVKSARVIEKIGFERETVKKKAEFLPDGRLVDKHCYAMTDKNRVPAMEVQWGA